MQFLRHTKGLNTVQNRVLFVLILKIWQITNLFDTFVANKKLLLDVAGLDFCSALDFIIHLRVNLS